jgi:hypothetical protein
MEILSIKCVTGDHQHGHVGLPLCEAICLQLRSVARVGALRFVDGRTANPNWPNVGDFRYELLMSNTNVWVACDDAGSRIGWASFDREDRVYIDGESEGIACVKIASHSHDGPNAFERGFLVLFLRELQLMPSLWYRIGMARFFGKSGSRIFLRPF